MPDSLSASNPVSDEALYKEIRPVTDGEVAFFDQNGWVILRGLVSPSLCKDILDTVKARMGDGLDIPDPAGAANAPAGPATGRIKNISWWNEWRGAVRAANDPVLSRFALARAMGQNARRLLQRDRSMRIFHDMVLCKRPLARSKATDWHQDAPTWPFERNGFTAWLALDEITPQQGGMQFYSGSHRLGLLGDARVGGPDIVAEYPELERFAVSPPPHLQPGDCSVHHGLVVHGAGANTTPNPRWSYAVTYFPADARYTGAPNHDADGFGLVKGKTFDHPSFKLVPD